MTSISPPTASIGNLNFLNFKTTLNASYPGRILETAFSAFATIEKAFHQTTINPTILVWASRVKTFGSLYKDTKKVQDLATSNICNILETSKNAAQDLSFIEVQIHGDGTLGSQLIGSIDQKLLKAFSNYHSEAAEKKRKHAAIKFALKEHGPHAEGSSGWKLLKKELLVFYMGKYKKEAFLEKVRALLDEAQNLKSALSKELIDWLGKDSAQQNLLASTKDLEKGKVDPDLLKILLKIKYGDKLISTIDTCIADPASCKKAVIQSGIRNHERHLGDSLQLKERHISILESLYLKREKLTSLKFEFQFRCLQLITAFVSFVALPLLLRISLTPVSILIPSVITTGVLEFGLEYYKAQEPETPLVESLKRTQ